MTIFSKIIAGEIPAYKIAEDDYFLAFLDIFPFAEGHTVVVPKLEIDRLFDLPSQYLAGYLPFCQPIAQAIQKTLGCNRVNVLTLGFEVPHAHIHLIPMNSVLDVADVSKKITVSPAQLQAMQQRICQHL